MVAPKPRSPLSKLFYLGVGWFALGMSVLGIFLPLLPTTPFLLLACACFMRGSQRMALWLLNHRWFGSYIRDFHENRGLTVQTKVRAIVVMWVSLALSAYIVPLVWVRWFLLVPGICVTVYLWRFKTRGPLGSDATISD